MRNLIHSSIAIADYATPLQEAWGDVVDIRQEQADEWRQLGWGESYGGFSTGRADDRRGGSLRPVYETERDLDELRAISRVIAECTPTGISILRNLTNYVIGSGFVYKAAPKAAARRDETAKSLAMQVQGVIDQFIEANNWDMDRERELFHRSCRDGEYFLGLWNVDGHLQVRIIDPERVRDPGGQAPAEVNWQFGVETEATDVESVLAYHVQWDEQANDWEGIAAEKLLHCKRNVDSNIKRGVSDFFAVNADVSAVKRLLRNMVRGGSVQAAIAYIREHAAGVTKSQIEDMRQTNATMRYTQTTATGPRTAYVMQDKPGTVVDVPNGQQYKGAPLGNSEAANAFVAIQQAGLRSIGSRWCMPEYMISGDASNANYASTKEAGTPFVKNAEFEQAMYAKRYRQVMWRAVQIACEAKRIAVDYDTVRAIVDLQVEPEAVVIRDPDRETNRRSVLFDRGLLSRETWSAQEGLDPQEETANGAQAQREDASESVQERLSRAARILWEGYP